MQRPRLIPVLLLKDDGLVKSRAFKDHKYVGDPINAVKIFNDSLADELIFLDIMATKNKRLIPLAVVKNIGEEARMPFAVGGGINTLKDIESLIHAGAERVIINSKAGLDPNFIKKAAVTFGSSTIVVCMDVKKNFLGRERVWINNGTRQLNYSPIAFASLMEEMGAGEIVIQSISRDGMMDGYDHQLIKSISTSVSVPVIALGGAGNYTDMKLLYENTYVNGLAAGSLFVYHGKDRGVLINYPSSPDINILG